MLGGAGGESYLSIIRFGHNTDVILEVLASLAFIITTKSLVGNFDSIQSNFFIAFHKVAKVLQINTYFIIEM